MDIKALLLETLRWIVVNKEHLYGVGSGSVLVKEDVYKQWEELVTLDHLAPSKIFRYIKWIALQLSSTCEYFMENE